MNSHGINKNNLLAAFPLALQKDKSAASIGDGTAELLTARLREIDLLRIYTRIDELDEEMLDILAYDFKVDWWDPNYTVEEKRQTLKDSWLVHKKMGTKAAVEAAISAIYPATKVQEWFEYGGKPYWFKLQIDLSGVLPNPEGHARVLNRVNFYKNLRSHIEEIEYIIKPDHDDTVHMGGCMAAIVCLPIMELADNIRFDDKARFGGVLTTDSCLPIPEVPDEIQLDGATRIGGRIVAHSSLPIPEIEDTPCFASSMHTGGRTMTRVFIPVPESKS